MCAKHTHKKDGEHARKSFAKCPAKCPGHRAIAQTSSEREGVRSVRCASSTPTSGKLGHARRAQPMRVFPAIVMLLVSLFTTAVGFEIKIPSRKLVRVAIAQHSCAGVMTAVHHEEVARRSANAYAALQPVSDVRSDDATFVAFGVLFALAYTASTALARSAK